MIFVSWFVLARNLIECKRKKRSQIFIQNAFQTKGSSAVELSCERIYNYASFENASSDCQVALGANDFDLMVIIKIDFTQYFTTSLATNESRNTLPRLLQPMNLYQLPKYSHLLA